MRRGEAGATGEVSDGVRARRQCDGHPAAGSMCIRARSALRLA